MMAGRSHDSRRVVEANFARWDTVREAAEQVIELRHEIAQVGRLYFDGAELGVGKALRARYGRVAKWLMESPKLWADVSLHRGFLQQDYVPAVLQAHQP